VSAQAGGPLTISGLEGIPEVEEGDDLAALITAAAAGSLQSGDVLVVAQKVVSKAEGAVRDLADVSAGERAQALARELDKDPRLIQLVLDESVRILRQSRALIVETKHGFVCANAGIDRSNVPGDTRVTLLPEDSDASAAHIRERIADLTGCNVAVIISDTFGRPWRMGLVNVALGVAGLDPLINYVGTLDAQGRPMHVSQIAVADELASAAELVTGKVNHVPVVIIRGFKWESRSGSGRDLLRPGNQDMFR
jgi:coenzyme F420-0:L-glutamate ligase/coenzyme F420-1:gamma-L-glutamate ligase